MFYIHSKVAQKVLPRTSGAHCIVLRMKIELRGVARPQHCPTARTDLSRARQWRFRRHVI